MTPATRWLLAGALILWFVTFIPTNDSIVLSLAVLWLAYLLAEILWRNRTGDRH